MFKKMLHRLCDENPEVGGGVPAAEPQPEVSAVEDFSDNLPDAMWDELSRDDVEEPVAEAPPEEPAAQPAQPTTEQPPQEIAPAAEQPQAVQPEQPATVPQEQQLTPEQKQQAEMAYVAQLERLYQFDEDTALKLQTEPEKVLPALAAKLHLDVMKTVLAQVQGMIPTVLEKQTVAAKREQEAESMFFTTWPELRGYDKQIMEVGRMYRQLNPNAPAEEAVKRIGEITMATLGMTRAQQQQAVQQQTQPSAYRPAAPGRPASAPAPKSLWEDLAADDDD